ncbi:Protein STRUBBELIG-RECEPTOR FAMILY 7 [Camellia lanceoleosa]|uniref:Protein STRUBBELIG-RECEPTOR FAMILY 7 n=1 Tax=Camellia lanceoleosa TaxID=1840588 RepID=A0ACC0F1P4_9ERIC|nr:Protein STRUBBELIG-RECEPTOR FAMILY 7 [Camellia lanceoleosa]
MASCFKHQHRSDDFEGLSGEEIPSALAVSQWVLDRITEVSRCLGLSLEGHEDEAMRLFAAVEASWREGTPTPKHTAQPPNHNNTTTTISNSNRKDGNSWSSGPAPPPLPGTPPVPSANRNHNSGGNNNPSNGGSSGGGSSKSGIGGGGVAGIVISLLVVGGLVAFFIVTRRSSTDVEKLDNQPFAPLASHEARKNKEQLVRHQHRKKQRTPRLPKHQTSNPEGNKTPAVATSNQPMTAKNRTEQNHPMTDGASRAKHRRKHGTPRLTTPTASQQQAGATLTIKMDNNPEQQPIQNPKQNQTRSLSAA